jgi:hypothetical protein
VLKNATATAMVEIEQKKGAGLKFSDVSSLYHIYIGA